MLSMLALFLGYDSLLLLFAIRDTSMLYNISKEKTYICDDCAASKGTKLSHEVCKKKNSFLIEPCDKVCNWYYVRKNATRDSLVNFNFSISIILYP